LLAGFVLAGCAKQPAAQPTASGPSYSGALETEYENALDAIDQLALGTLRLDQTQHAVTEGQAAELLPLWQSLQGSDLQGDAERYAVARLIEAKMSDAQVSEIAAMQLTEADATNWMQSQGNGNTNTAAAPSAGKGQRPDGETSALTEEQIATRQAKLASQGGDTTAMSNGGNARFPSNAVVVLLRERSGAAIAQAATATPTSSPEKLDPTPTMQKATATPTKDSKPEETATPTPTAEAETPTPAAPSEKVPTPTATPILVTRVSALTQIEDTDPGPPFTIEISGNTATQDPIVADSQRYRITGLARNDGDQTYAVSALHVTLYDPDGFRGTFTPAIRDGKLVGGEWDWHNELDAEFAALLLAPGEVWPFDIEITAQNVASFLIHPDAVATERQSMAVDLGNVKILQTSTDFIRITGTATNNGLYKAKNVTVTGVLLDTNGQMVSVGSVYVLQENIEPGASISFDLRIEQEAFASYQLYAQAERDWS
jgi:hypothetical protein